MFAAGSDPHPPSTPLFRAPFLRLIGARGLSSLAFLMLAVALGWHLYALTRSPFALGMLGLAQFLPMFALTLPAGHAIDRHDRRRIAALCQTALAAVALLFTLGAWGHWLTAPLIYLLAGCAGAARAFESPANTALLPAVAARAQLPQATAVSTAVNQAAQIAGPAAGGLLYGVGAVPVFLTCALAWVCAALLMGTLALPHAAALAPKPPATLQAVLGGIRFIRAQPVILGALSLDLFAVLFGGATALLPVFARDILHSGPLELGLLRSASALGALAGTLWLARRPLRQRPGLAMFGGVIVYGLGTVVFGLSSHFLLSLAALAVLGAADVVSVVMRMSLVQLRTPSEMLGRVGAVNALFVGTSNQLGEFESGLTAHWWGARPAAVIGGAASIAVALLWMRLFPALRQMRSLAPEDQR